MFSMLNRERPYFKLGDKLKQFRERSKLSLSEVSDALEIDEKRLQKIEAGAVRPDEDLMLLMINYFNMLDQEALKVWQLADYDTELGDHLMFEENVIDNTSQAKPVIVLIANEPKTMYTDGVSVGWNKAGLTMEFTQATPKGQISIAKLGMSYEQSVEVLKCLESAILKAKYTEKFKLLPPKIDQQNSKGK
jgi:transcriptional regulator with XRE-family HTH domain